MKSLLALMLIVVAAIGPVSVGCASRIDGAAPKIDEVAARSADKARERAKRLRGVPTTLAPSFHANLGQFAPPVDYSAPVPGGRMQLMSGNAVALMQGRERPYAIGWRFAGARARAPESDNQLPGIANYFVGKPASWRTDVPTFGRVRYREIYNGIDLVYYGVAGAIEFDLEVASGADPADIAIAIDNAESVTVDSQNGSLAIAVKDGELRWKAPDAYQGHGPNRSVVSARYVVSDGEVRFALGPYDRTRPLVIDPVLMMSTLLGGGADDAGGGVVVNDAGEAFVTGTTVSADYPVTPGAYDTTASTPSDAFVTRLSGDGTSVVFSTYLGGNASDAGYAIALDDEGNVHVVGTTVSADFPSVNAYQPSYIATQCVVFGPSTRPCADAFVAKLSPDGNALLYSTFFGGASDDVASAVAIGPMGHAFVFGSTTSADLPTLNAVDTTYEPNTCGFEVVTSPCRDVFVTQFSTSGSALVYSTYLGGGIEDLPGRIVVDAANRATVVGMTNSDNFNVAAALQPLRAPGSCGIGPISFSCYDFFISRIAAGGGVLVFSTYLGGAGDDRGTDIALGPDESIWITGHTTSSNFPVMNPIQATLAGPSPADAQCFPMGSSSNTPCPDAVLARLNTTGSALLFSTYYGGVRRDESNAIAVDSMGRVTIGGMTHSFDFPLVDAWQNDYILNSCNIILPAVCGDAFIVAFSTGAAGVSYSTYLGGFGSESVKGLAALADGSVIAAGVSGPDFPTTPSAFRPAGAANEAFVVRMAAPPAIGMLATFAGTGEPGSAAPASTQALRTSLGVLMDVAVLGNNRYVADSSNHRILKIDAANRMSVIAGTGSPGFSGDFGPATAAELNGPSGVAVDPGGNVYVADSGNNRVRMIMATGGILTIAGTGFPAFSGDGGPSYLASLNYPVGLEVHGSFLVIADTGNRRVRMIGPDGNIMTVAGNGTDGSTGDGMLAGLASLSLPTGVVIDSLGRLLISDFGAHKVRAVNPVTGIISTIAGTGVAGSGGDNGPATAATLNGPFGIDARAGHIVVVELLGHRVRRIDAGGTIFTLAGTGILGPVQIPPVAGTASPLFFPSSAAISGDNVLISDIGNYRLAMAHRALP